MTLPRPASRTEGWTVIPIAACMFCGGELTLPCEEKNPAPAGGSARLSALFGGETLARVEIAPGTECFCRTCSHYLVHPFRSFCVLKEQDVDPMGDCPEFQSGEKGKNDAVL